MFKLLITFKKAPYWTFKGDLIKILPNFSI